MEAIPDVPEEIDIQLQRTEFITTKLIDKVADEENEDVVGVQEEVPIHQHALAGTGRGGSLIAALGKKGGKNGDAEGTEVYGIASGRMSQ